MNTGMNMDLDMDMFVDMDTDPDILKNKLCISGFGLLRYRNRLKL
jgi:hypothetical protein